VLTDRFGYLFLSIAFFNIFILGIWSYIGHYFYNLYKPRTVDYYISQGYTSSYVYELLKNKNESEIIPIIIAIVTFIGIIFIVYRLINKLENVT